MQNETNEHGKGPWKTERRDNMLFLINSLIRMCTMVSMQKLGDTLQGLVLSYCVRPVGYPLVVRYGGKCLYSLSHLVGKSVWLSKEPLY